MAPLRHLISDNSIELSSTLKALSLEQVDTSNDSLALRLQDGVLSLAFPGRKQGDVVVDFNSSASEYRRMHGGAYGQPIAKALALSPKISPSILDMTAGLGRDAFVMASLGARVTLYERNPVVFSLLQNGLERAIAGGGEVAEVCSLMQLYAGDSGELKEEGGRFDLVYVDPMFPVRGKAAAVKKEMAAFHELVGQDEDSDRLLALALSLAEYRVVVKRPKNAPYLADCTPSVVHKGKAGRFDIYSKRAIKPAEFISVRFS